VPGLQRFAKVAFQRLIGSLFRCVLAVVLVVLLAPLLQWCAAGGATPQTLCWSI
jgi:hypothetical protein